jgi:hypothetical protein
MAKRKSKDEGSPWLIVVVAVLLVGTGIFGIILGQAGSRRTDLTGTWAFKGQKAFSFRSDHTYTRFSAGLPSDPTTETGRYRISQNPQGMPVVVLLGVHAGGRVADRELRYRLMGNDAMLMEDRVLERAKQ